MKHPSIRCITRRPNVKTTKIRTYKYCLDFRNSIGSSLLEQRIVECKVGTVQDTTTSLQYPKTSELRIV